MTTAAPALDRSHHQVVYKATRPELTITRKHGTSTNRGYHETLYEVVSAEPLNDVRFARLDAAGVLGMGQSYRIVKSDTFVEPVPPVTVDRRTGEVLADVEPVNWRGEAVTSTHDFHYHRYLVERICDSGD